MSKTINLWKLTINICNFNYSFIKVKLLIDGNKVINVQVKTYKLTQVISKVDILLDESVI